MSFTGWILSIAKAIKKAIDVTIFIAAATPISFMVAMGVWRYYYVFTFLEKQTKKERTGSDKTGELKTKKGKIQTKLGS